MAKPKSGKKSLKDALLNQQVKLKKIQQAKEAAQRQEAQEKAKAASITGKNKAKGKGKEIATRDSVIPLSVSDRILLIGEGNFSFALSLFKHPALQFLPPANVTATAYDSETACYEKYPDARSIVQELKEKGAEVLFDVDGTKLEKVKQLKGRRWDRVMWNFPHAGSGITDQDRNILANQRLLLGFLRSVAVFLERGGVPVIAGSKKHKKRGPDSDSEADSADDDGDPILRNDKGYRGTVLITLRNVHPYTDWDLPNLAKRPPVPTAPSASPNPQYILLRSFAFHRSVWPGYEHRMTKGERANGTGTTGVGGEDRCWEFCLKD